MSRLKAIKDLADLNYEQGLFSGRWEDEYCREDCVESYLESMKRFADEYDIEYSTDLDDYKFDDNEADYELKEHMGYELFCLVQDRLNNIVSDSLIRTYNEITSSNPYEQEVASLEAILKSYKEERYNNVFILVMNYLGHIDHYCGHSGLVYRMLNNLTFSLEKKAKGELTEENDGFKKFVESRLLHAREGL